VNPDVNVLALIKGKDRFVFVYDDASRETLIEHFRDRASDPRCPISWFDAMVLTEKARWQGELAMEPEPPPLS